MSGRAVQWAQPCPFWDHTYHVYLLNWHIWLQREQPAKLFWAPEVVESIERHHIVTKSVGNYAGNFSTRAMAPSVMIFMVQLPFVVLLN
jgi:hypothetical protein